MTKTVEEVVDHLIAVCAIPSGGRGRNARYSISRKEIRDYYDGYRIESSTLKKISDGLREEGYQLIPVDSSDLRHTGTFVVAKTSVLSKCREYADIGLEEDEDA